MVLTSYGHGVLCTLEQSEVKDASSLWEPESMSATKVGCPILEEVETHRPDSASTIEAEISSATDTDIEHIMEFPHSDPVLPELIGVSKAQVCPNCGEDIDSGLALIRHMKSKHPGVHLHKCESCDSAFNNKKKK